MSEEIYDVWFSYEIINGLMDPWEYLYRIEMIFKRIYRIEEHITEKYCKLIFLCINYEEIRLSILSTCILINCFKIFVNNR